MTKTATKTKAPKTTPIVEPKLPASPHELAERLGLRVVMRRDVSETVEMEDGGTRLERLPSDLVGLDGKTLIKWTLAGANGYAFDGYWIEHDGMFGGVDPSIWRAFAWLRDAMAIRAGTSRDFGNQGR